MTMLAFVMLVYLCGLIHVAVGDSVAARDPRRFWWALVAWPVVAPIGAVNSLLNRM